MEIAYYFTPQIQHMSSNLPFLGSVALQKAKVQPGLLHVSVTRIKYSSPAHGLIAVADLDRTLMESEIYVGFSNSNVIGYVIDKDMRDHTKGLSLPLHTGSKLRSSNDGHSCLLYQQSVSWNSMDRLYHSLRHHDVTCRPSDQTFRLITTDSNARNINCHILQFLESSPSAQDTQKGRIFGLGCSKICIGIFMAVPDPVVVSVPVVMPVAVSDPVVASEPAALASCPVSSTLCIDPTDHEDMSSHQSASQSHVLLAQRPTRHLFRPLFTPLRV
ncbi:hypothetical protein IMY05_C4665000100 [Salix suchowensis]|nr:hypothetical protein IMY05_C4665000100 [Salix suchowensis]